MKKSLLWGLFLCIASTTIAADKKNGLKILANNNDLNDPNRSGAQVVRVESDGQVCIVSFISSGFQGGSSTAMNCFPKPAADEKPAEAIK